MAQRFVLAAVAASLFFFSLLLVNPLGVESSRVETKWFRFVALLSAGP